MGTISIPDPVKLICGVLYSDPKQWREAEEHLQQRFGPVDFQSEVFPFQETDYYDREMGMGLSLHIIGFGIQEAEHRGQLESIARSTNGNYLDAKNADELFSSLEETLQVEFIVEDEKGEAVGSGFAGGEAVGITEGTYTLRLMLEPETLEQKITIKAEQTLTFTLIREEGKWVLKESKQEAL